MIVDSSAPRPKNSRPTEGVAPFPRKRNTRHGKAGSEDRAIVIGSTVLNDAVESGARLWTGPG